MTPNKDGVIIITLVSHRVSASNTHTFRTHIFITHTYYLYVTYDTEHSGAIPSI